MTTRNIFFLTLSLLIFQCAEDAPTDTKDAPTYTVTFESNGGNMIDPLTVTKDAKVNKPTDPTRDGYTFKGWYSDEAKTIEYNFTTTTVTADITLYAKWKAGIGVIPDDNFRAVLQAVVGGAFEGELIDPTHSDVLSLKELNVGDRNIASLEGIEYFSALNTLQCYGNKLSSLDLSSNTALTKLSCGRNQLTRLDLSSNTALTELYCAVNQLSTLDISSNTALTKLYCAANQLSTLDISSNTALTTLECNNNQLSSLNVTSNTALTVLNCANNQLSSLGVTSNTALTELQCNDNQLSGLDVTSNTALTWLYCYKNQLTTLDLSKSSNTASIEFRLRCQDNQLTSLDLRGIKRFYDAPAGNASSINAGTATNPITDLKVHTAAQTYDEIKEAKTNRGDAITISTYDDANAQVCADFDPTEGTAGTCKD